MQVLQSRQLVEKIQTEIKRDAVDLIDRGIDPQLAIVMVGNNPASARYVGIKSERGKELGIICSLYHMEEGTTYEEIEATLKYLALDEEIHGIILQLPLPANFTREQTNRLIAAIPAEKDVDGLRGSWKTDALAKEPYSLETMLSDHVHSLPPMVMSVLSLLDFYGITFANKQVVLVGKGRLVGEPLETYLKKSGAKVVSVDEETRNILKTTQTADILISGTGQDDLITYQWVKEGAVVVDCARDVHRDSVDQVASAVGPATGGVGPLTVAWLLHNLIQACSHSVTKKI